MSREQMIGKLRDLAARFQTMGWGGPRFSTPEETQAYYSRFGESVPPHWEVWLELSGVPDSRHPDRTGEPIRASLRLDNQTLIESSVEAIAMRLAAAVAVPAHETLEWTRFDGELVWDPHGDAGQLHGATRLISEYLLGGSAS